MNWDFLSLAEYGIAMFTIGGTFAILVWIIMTFLKALKEMREEHRCERQVWDDREDKRSERSDKVLSELTDAIRESIEVNRSQMRGPE